MADPENGRSTRPQNARKSDFACGHGKGWSVRGAGATCRILRLTGYESRCGLLHWQEHRNLREWGDADYGEIVEGDVRGLCSEHSGGQAGCWYKAGVAACSRDEVTSNRAGRAHDGIRIWRNGKSEGNHPLCSGKALVPRDLRISRRACATRGGPRRRCDSCATPAAREEFQLKSERMLLWIVAHTSRAILSRSARFVLAVVMIVPPKQVSCW